MEAQVILYKRGDEVVTAVSYTHLYRFQPERSYLHQTVFLRIRVTSKVRFTIQGKNTAIRPVEHREKYAFKWDKTNYLQEP